MKVPRPVLLKQPVLPHRRDIDIGKAIVIVVGDRNAQPVHLNGKPGALSHIGKRAVAIVPIKLHRAALPLVTRPVAAVHQQNVEPAVIIVIEKGAARPHGFGQKLRPVSAAVVVEIQYPRRL